MGGSPLCSPELHWGVASSGTTWQDNFLSYSLLPSALSLSSKVMHCCIITTSVLITSPRKVQQFLFLFWAGTGFWASQSTYLGSPNDSSKTLWGSRFLSAPCLWCEPRWHLDHVLAAAWMSHLHQQNACKEDLAFSRDCSPAQLSLKISWCFT